MEYRNTHMKALVDLFSLGEANLLANVVQYFEDHNIRYTPAAVAEVPTSKAKHALLVQRITHCHTCLATPQDANEALEYVHMSGIMHNKVLEDLPSYLMPDPDIKQVMYVHLPQLCWRSPCENPDTEWHHAHISTHSTRFRNDGKQLFLLTNSTFAYIDPGMRFLFGDDWRQV